MHDVEIRAGRAQGAQRSSLPEDPVRPMGRCQRLERPGRGDCRFDHGGSRLAVGSPQPGTTKPGRQDRQRGGCTGHSAASGPRLHAHPAGNGCHRPRQDRRSVQPIGVFGSRRPGGGGDGGAGAREGTRSRAPAVRSLRASRSWGNGRNFVVKDPSFRTGHRGAATSRRKQTRCRVSRRGWRRGRPPGSGRTLRRRPHGSGPGRCSCRRTPGNR
jgi:hypothetical protein